jgi:hypothetical protein
LHLAAESELRLHVLARNTPRLDSGSPLQTLYQQLIRRLFVVFTSTQEAMNIQIRSAIGASGTSTIIVAVQCLHDTRSQTQCGVALLLIGHRRVNVQWNINQTL